jgi:uracil-DNA glycosylase family 4
LRTHCSEIARGKRRAFRDHEYWGKPVPNFGDPAGRLLIVGLAPAAHGANRTGRMFTGDRSGDWLYRALHKIGFANQAAAADSNDGLRLHNCAITAVCHCAPPQNRPTREELDHCGEWLRRTLDLVAPRVMLALGQIAWQSLNRELAVRGWLSRKAKFQHGAEVPLCEGRWLLASFHPSQQNTFTGRLTEPMLDNVMARASELTGSAGHSRDCSK